MNGNGSKVNSQTLQETCASSDQCDAEYDTPRKTEDTRTQKRSACRPLPQVPKVLPAKHALFPSEIPDRVNSLSSNARDSAYSSATSTGYYKRHDRDSITRVLSDFDSMLDQYQDEAEYSRLGSVLRVRQKHDYDVVQGGRSNTSRHRDNNERISALYAKPQKHKKVTSTTSNNERISALYAKPQKHKKVTSTTSHTAVKSKYLSQRSDEGIKGSVTQQNKSTVSCVSDDEDSPYDSVDSIEEPKYKKALPYVSTSEYDDYNDEDDYEYIDNTKRNTMIDALLRAEDATGRKKAHVTFDDEDISPLDRSTRRRAMLHARQKTKHSLGLRTETGKGGRALSSKEVLDKHVKEALPMQVVFNKFGRALLDGNDESAQEAKKHKPVQEMRDKTAPLGFSTKKKRLGRQTPLYDLKPRTVALLKQLTRDEKLLYTQLYEKLELIKCLRKLNFEKPIRIVYVDYDQALRASHKGFSGAVDKRRGRDTPTAFAKALLETQYGMLLRANTIYVLSTSNNTKSNLYSEIQDLGIFDLCVSANPGVKMQISGDTSLLGVIGKPKHLVGAYVFRQAILEQLINVLRTQYNVPQVEVMLIDGSSGFIAHMEAHLARQGVDGIFSVNTHDIKDYHIDCVLGKCSDKLHRHLADSYGDPNNATSKCTTFPVVDRVITNRNLMVPYEYGNGHGISTFLSDNHKFSDNLVLSVAMARQNDPRAKQKEDITHRIRIHSMNLSDLFHNIFCLNTSDF